MRNNKSNTMNHESLSSTTVVMAALLIATMIGEAILSNALLRMAVMATAALGFGGYMWMRQRIIRSGKPIYEPIVRQLLRAGYKCGVGKNDSICIQMENVNLLAQVWPMPSKNQKRVHFSAFVEVDRNEISEDGLNYLATQYNARHKYTTVLLREEGLECRVETVVGKMSDVLGELSFAYKHIEQAAYSLMRNYPHVAKLYPAKPVAKRRIGFMPSVAAEPNGQSPEQELSDKGGCVWE